MVDNLINGLNIFFMNGLFFVFGFENFYIIELFEIIWVDVLISFLLEFFVIDLIVFEFGVVYDGFGSDLNKNCFENLIFGEDS